MAAFNRRRLLLLKSNLLLLLYLANRRKKLKFKKKRECWIRDIYQDREEKGEYHSLVKELKIHDRDYFFRCFRMAPPSTIVKSGVNCESNDESCSFPSTAATCIRFKSVPLSRQTG